MIWQPARANGWWPRVHVTPDRRIWVAYGNWLVVLAELRRTAAGLELIAEHVLAPETREGNRTGAAQWIRPYTLTAWRERDDIAAEPLLAWERFELDVRDLDAGWRRVAGPGTDVGGNHVRARDGHTLEWHEGRLRFDGRDLGWRGGAISTCEGWAAYPSDGNHQHVVRRSLGGVIQQWPVQAALYEIACGPDGHIAYGGYGGRIVGIESNGRHVDLTVTPWRSEGLHQLWRGRDGRVWVATTTWVHGPMRVLLRPWGEQDCVVLERDAAFLSIAEDEDAWIVASSTDVGRCTVELIPMSTPRLRVTSIEPPQEPLRFPAIADVTPIKGPFLAGAWAGGGVTEKIANPPQAGNAWIGATDGRGLLRFVSLEDADKFPREQIAGVLRHYPDYTDDDTALEQAKKHLVADVAAARAKGLGFYGYVDDVVDDELADLMVSVNGPDCRWGETCALGDRYKQGETVDQFVERFRARHAVYARRGLYTAFVLRADIRGIGRRADGSLIGAVRADEQCWATVRVLQLVQSFGPEELGIDCLFWFGRGREGEIPEIWPLINAALAGATPFPLHLETIAPPAEEDDDMPPVNETADQARERLALDVVRIVYADELSRPKGTALAAVVDAEQAAREAIDAFERATHRRPTSYEAVQFALRRRYESHAAADAFAQSRAS